MVAPSAPTSQNNLGLARLATQGQIANTSPLGQELLAAARQADNAAALVTFKGVSGALSSGSIALSAFPGFLCEPSVWIELSVQTGRCVFISG